MAFDKRFALNEGEALTEEQISHQDFITVARNGKPVAGITLINETLVSRRIGVAKGKFTVKGDFDAENGEIAEMLIGGAL